MEDHRGQLLGATTGIAAIVGIFLGLVHKRPWLTDLLVIVLILALLATVAFLVSYGRSWFRDRRSRSEPVGIEPALEEASGRSPAPPFTARWRYSTEGAEAVGVMNSFNKSVSHPAYMQNSYGTKPSKVMLVVLVPCDPLVELPPTSTFVKSFLDLLSSSLVGKLISMLARVEGGLSWYSYGSIGVLHNQAILARSADDPEPPVATALLNVNDSSIKYQHFQDPRRAELIITIERRPEGALTLRELHNWLLEALKVPDAFASFLSDEVHVSTYDDLAVHVGVSLEGRNDLIDLISPGDATAPPGTPRARNFLIYLLGEPTGKDARLAAIDALRGVCDYGLHVHGYEPQLDELRT